MEPATTYDLLSTRNITPPAPRNPNTAATHKPQVAELNIAADKAETNPAPLNADCPVPIFPVSLKEKNCIVITSEVRIDTAPRNMRFPTVNPCDAISEDTIWPGVKTITQNIATESNKKVRKYFFSDRTALATLGICMNLSMAVMAVSAASVGEIPNFGYLFSGKFIFFNQILAQSPIDKPSPAFTATRAFFV